MLTRHHRIVVSPASTMKENPLQYRVRGTPVPTTRTRGTNYPESTQGFNVFGSALCISIPYDVVQRASVNSVSITLAIGKSNPIPTVRFWVNAIENQEMNESKLPSDGDIRADTELSL